MKHNLYDMIQQKQGSSHDCTDNTTSATRHHKGAKPAQGLRKILAILMLTTISISAWSQTNANYVPFEFYTSINQITGNFAIVNAAEGKALYGTNNQNIGYANYATAFATGNVVTQYRLELVNGNYRLRCVTPAGGNYGLWGSNPCYLNCQPTTGNNAGNAIFNLGQDQDQANGSTWILNYVNGRGWTIESVARRGWYCSNNNQISQTPYYWQLCSLHETTQSTIGGYTFISNETNGYFLNSSAQASQTFAENTCVWTAGATMGGTSTTLRIGTTYLRGRNNNNANTARTGSNTDWYTTIWRSVNNYLVHYSSENRYVYRNNNNVPAWNNNTTRPNAAFGVYPTCTKTNGFFIVDEITGITDEITSTGTYNLQSTAYFCPTYYTFTGGPDTRYYAAGYTTGAVTTAISAKTSNFTSDTWTLSRSLPGVSINNGQLVITSLPGGQNDITITHTVTENGQTLSKTKTVRLIGRYETTLTFANVAPTVSADGWNVVLPSVTLKSGETTLTGRTITYSGTNCTVNNNGEVNNINGTATITASFAGDVTYAPSSTTYTITATDHQALNETIIGDIAITPATATLNLGGRQDYSVPASVTAQTRTCEQYTEYSFPVGSAYRYAGSSWKFTLTEPTITENPNATANLTQVVWSFSGGAGSYYTPSTYSSTTTNVVTLTRTGQGLTDDQEYTITATATYGSVNREATAKVVIPAPIVDLSGITANPASYTIAVGGSADITCDYATTIVGRPYVSLTYSGYNTNLISVDANGRITGLAEGTTTVTIQSKKQGGTNGPRTTVSVTVSNGSGTQADPYRIANVDGLVRMNTNKTAYFIVTADFDASSYNTAITDFAGTLDGDFHTISGLKIPLFSSISGGTVKNVRLKEVTINRTGTDQDAGAIANTAANAKIYNCGVLSGSVSGTRNVGGLVGQISGSTKVVNNYSYAKVKGGATAGGIVGYNSVAATTSTKPITNNIMYGDMTEGTNRYPVYGGNHTDNIKRANEYNYYRSRADLTYTTYNEQLAIDKDEFLTRFPFYRHIMNTHRELAAINLFGSRTDANVNEIGHWVLKPEVAAYPIIEAWKTNTKKTTEEIRDNLPTTTEDYAGRLLTEMGNNGYLKVNYNINGTTGSIDLPITDMDTLNYDFTWGKVVLPFVNEISGWTRDWSKICTGWRITGVTGGTPGTLTNYNFADRNCTNKDLYANNGGYVFAQGGNYIVPYGVTAINVTANFANAYYLSDPNYDMAYDAAYANATGIAGTVPTTYHGQTVYTSLSTLMGKLSAKTNPHEQAIVLVGNYHYNQNTIGGHIFGDNTNTTKGVTIMSVDEDNNQEPDYGWYSYHTTDRTDIPPMRFDFVPNIGIGMAARVKGSTPYPTIGIWHSHGWFELTETCVSFMSECEINSYSFNANDNGTGNNRWIANSGYFIQIVRARDGNCGKLSYIQIGGNAFVKEFYPGSHTDQARSVTLRPIIVNGGEIEQCFMTGYKAGATATGSDIRFFSAGGRMHKWLAAYVENPSSDGVNVTAKIDHAIIRRFFGGGTSSAARVKGNIDVTIDHSFVDFYCGGPEFGDMYDGKTVTTRATGTTFGLFYGAGYGGTSITRNREAQNAGVNFGSNQTYNLAFTNYTNKRLNYSSDGGYPGFGVNYSFEYILYSGGSGTGVSRFYTGYATFSLAQTGAVSSTLNDCTIGYYKDGKLVGGTFCGGGCQGTVNGNTTSKLTNCVVYGHVFGGGYKAPETTVDVYPTTQPTYSVYTKETGLFSDFGTVNPEKYKWVQGTGTTANTTTKELPTNVDFSNLGKVMGSNNLTVDGCRVYGCIFGGGSESETTGNTTVTVKGNTNVGTYDSNNKLLPYVDIFDENGNVIGRKPTGNVYGGGNAGDVGGNTNVVIGE